MMTIDQVETIRQQLLQDGVPKPNIIRQLATDCMGWPYVFGAWGEKCTPEGRRKRASADHPTIVSKCPALNGKTCAACSWGIGVRMYDCRGFTRWLLQQVGLDITGAGATSQYNTASNWVTKGKISEMPDKVCCVFKYSSSTGKMEHTGMHVGGGVIIHCSTNVKTGKTSDKGWTHYAIPKGLYDEGEIPVDTTRPTLRRGSKGDDVVYLQERLTALGYGCGEIDGIFGLKTLNAVVKYQTLNNLDPDGIVGKKTWASLEGTTPEEQEREQYYTVICYGMTSAQAMQIREICPTAEMKAEG